MQRQAYHAAGKAGFQNRGRMDLCNGALTHVAVYKPEANSNATGYNIYNIQTGRHCAFLPAAPHTIDIQWPYILCAHSREVKLWRAIGAAVMPIAAFQIDMVAMAFVAPSVAVVVWNCDQRLAWAKFEVSATAMRPVRSGMMPPGQVMWMSATHIELLTDNCNKIQYFDMYSLALTPKIARSARLELKPTVPVQWDEQTVDLADRRHSELVSDLDGTTRVVLDSPVSSSRSEAPHYVQLSRVSISTCGAGMSVVLTAGIALAPDHSHIIIREDYVCGTAPVRFEKRHLVPFTGCQGNAAADKRLRVCANEGAGYLEYERRLHNLLLPVLREQIIRDIFMCF